MINSPSVTLNQEQFRDFKINFLSPARAFMGVEGLWTWATQVHAFDTYNQLELSLKEEGQPVSITFYKDDVAQFVRITERVRANLHNWKENIERMPYGQETFEKLEKLSDYLASIMPAELMADSQRKR